MSILKLGKISSFPPLPGQPYPPTRNHPRWKELYRLHDEWIMKYWPFKSEEKRARLPFVDLAGSATWLAPGADFDRMVWVVLLHGVCFLADDYIDSGKMNDRLPGLKKAATGTGPLHPRDRVEICHDMVFRGIKATCHPRTFAQLTKRTHEYWDSYLHESFRDVEHYLSIRRINVGTYAANAAFRYALDINLPDEAVDHPLMRETEGIIADHVGLVNDFFSYPKEKLTNSDDMNILRILQDKDGLTYEQALKLAEKMIRQKEQDFITAAKAVLDHPELGSDPEVHRWISCLPYAMGGNMAWCQKTRRYNLGEGIGDIPFPFLQCAFEETPADEVVDDTNENIMREAVLNVETVPLADLEDASDNVLPIETGDRDN